MTLCHILPERRGWVNMIIDLDQGVNLLSLDTLFLLVYLLDLTSDILIIQVIIHYLLLVDFTCVTSTDFHNKKVLIFAL